MYNQIVRLACLFFFLLITSAFAQSQPVPSIGYQLRELYQTTSYTYIGGLTVNGQYAYFGEGDSKIMRQHLGTGATNHIGTLPPPGVGASYVAWVDDRLHVGYAEDYSFPTPPFCRLGWINESGDFDYQTGINGVFDAAADSSGAFYINAATAVGNTRIYRYDIASTSLTHVITIGGFSGGIAFDSQDRLYVADNNNGVILRFTPLQLSAGNLSAADGEQIYHAYAGYLAFDHLDRLYLTTDGGNSLVMINPETGDLLRTIALDTGVGYGIGWIAWDRQRNALMLVYSDYFVAANSTLNAIKYDLPDSGIHGTSSVFKGWVAAYRDYIRPDITSGGYARDADAQECTPGEAIIGKPAVFDPDVWPLGNILSLGNGGAITLEFDSPIFNGPGPDFAVFENAFGYDDHTYTEFSYVEVATTTNAWARFPVTFLATNLFVPFGPAYAMIDVTDVDGLAGKHHLEYGTPFDLDWLKNHPNVLNGTVDLNRIAYVRLTDVIGNGTTFDDWGNPILDPHGALTSPTDGFDLRGVGVIHLAGVSVKQSGNEMTTEWYGYPGRTYQPQHLIGNHWNDLGSPITGTGGVHRITFTPDHSVHLMRIEQQIPFTP